MVISVAKAHGEVDVVCALCREQPPNTRELEELYAELAAADEKCDDPEEREAVKSHLGRHLTERGTGFVSGA